VIRALIVDDEPLARRGVRVCLRGATDVTITGECATGQEAVTQILRTKPDLAFLDVQMPGMNGFEVLTRIPREQCPLVIFLTAHDEYALRAFAVHALDYVLKPLDDDRFKEALDRARERLRQRSAQTVIDRLQALLADGRSVDAGTSYRQRFAIKTGHRTLLVPADDVTWFQASGDYVALHVGNKTHLLRETLDGLERQLDPHKFVRVHRSTIVSLDAIKELYTLSSRDFLVRLRDGTEVRASRRYKDRLQGFV
jgi:two-component system, LytTR family, response regulator